MRNVKIKLDTYQSANQSAAMHYTISADRKSLTIHVDEKEREVLRSYSSEHEEGEVPLHANSTMCDFLESLICNSELDWIDASETGDLTDAPMLGIMGEEGLKEHTVFLPNYGLRNTGFNGNDQFAVPILERWAWMSYQVRSLLEELRDKGNAVLVSGN